MRLQRWQVITSSVFLSLVCFISAGLVFLYGSYQRVSIAATPSIFPQTDPSPTPDPLRPYSIALLGYGGGGHAGGKLTDTIMIAQINPRTQEIYLISLPRDVWVSFPSSGTGETYWKVNAAYAIGSDQRGYASRPDEYKGKAGGGNLAKYALQKILGFPVDNFIAVNFAGFEKSVDVLGGLEIKVERTFDDHLYPIEGLEEDTCGKSEEEMIASATLSAELAEKAFPCRYEHLHFDAGVTHMDGETALKYVRSRHGAQDGTDFGRAARQRNLLIAAREKIFEVNFLPKAIPFISTMAGNLETDIPLSKMQEWIAQAGEFQNYTIKSIALTDKNVFAQGRSPDGQYIIMPKDGIDQWAGVHQYLQQELTATATLSGQVTPSP